MTTRPPFIVNGQDHLTKDDSTYTGSVELLSFGTNFSEHTGLAIFGIWLDVLKPGRRSSWPHTHLAEEEFIYVVEGSPDVWIDGALHRLVPGDGVGFPAGTGIAHCFINNTETDVHLLTVGEKETADDKIRYPLHPERNEEMKAKDRHWDDAPARELGAHDGKPDALREK